MRRFTITIALLVTASMLSCQGRDLTIRRIVQTFKQEASVKLDILWVLDNSNSMDEENPLVRAGADEFVGALVDSNADFQLGVVTMNVKAVASSESGKLQAAVGVDTIIKSTSDKATIISDFRATVAAVQAATTPSKGCEAGLEAARLAIDPSLNLNPGFIRDDALLAVIFLTDEDDASTNEATDDLCNFSTATTFPKIHDQLDDYIAFFRGQKVGNGNFIFNGILTLDKDSASCAAVNPKEASTNFVDLVERTGGLAGDICLTDYEDLLDSLGLKIAGFFSSFAAELPVDTDTLEVRIDGVLLDSTLYSYDSDNQKVVLDPKTVTLKPDQTVEISYNADFSDPDIVIQN